MLRILHVLGGLGSGGAEALIMNCYRNIDHNEIQFDFLVRSDDVYHEKEILQMGGSVYHTSSFPRHIIKNFRETRRIMMKKQWDVIHIHANAAIYILPLFLAKKYGYHCVIMHSHNTSSKRKVLDYLHRLNQRWVNRLSDVKLACSIGAGKWMYGLEPFTVLKNGIEVKKFVFNADKREQVRKQYGLIGKNVVGNVGRLSGQKNHMRILEIFSEIKKKQENVMLLLVGDGELQNQIRTYAKKLGIADSIVFAGRQSDVGAYLSAMDVFLFPSLWEGMPLGLIEAQISGLPCCANEELITDEIWKTELLKGLSLDEPNEKWANMVLELLQNRIERKITEKQLNSCGYDIEKASKSLVNIYLQGGKINER